MSLTFVLFTFAKFTDIFYYPSFPVEQAEAEMV